MQDSVADVLAERSALDTTATGGILLSLLLHAALGVFAYHRATHQPPPQPVTGVKIRFARLPQAERPAVVAAPKPQSDTPRIEAPKPRATEPVKPTTTAAEKNTVPLSPFGRSNRRGSENPVLAPPVAPPPSPASEDVTLEGGDFPYTLYIDRMKTMIGSRWLRPGTAAGMKTVIYFAIERDGRIRDARVATPSGHSTFDRAALRAVLESSPLPPLPFGYSGNYLGVHLIFR